MPIQSLFSVTKKGQPLKRKSFPPFPFASLRMSSRLMKKERKREIWKKTDGRKKTGTFFDPKRIKTFKDFLVEFF